MWTAELPLPWWTVAVIVVALMLLCWALGRGDRRDVLDAVGVLDETRRLHADMLAKHTAQLAAVQGRLDARFGAGPVVAAPPVELTPEQLAVLTEAVTAGGAPGVWLGPTTPMPAVTGDANPTAVDLPPTGDLDRWVGDDSDAQAVIGAAREADPSPQRMDLGSDDDGEDQLGPGDGGGDGPQLGPPSAPVPADFSTRFGLAVPVPRGYGVMPDPRLGEAARMLLRQARIRRVQDRLAGPLATVTGAVARWWRWWLATARDRAECAARERDDRRDLGVWTVGELGGQTAVIGRAIVPEPAPPRSYLPGHEWSTRLRMVSAAALLDDRRKPGRPVGAHRAGRAPGALGQRACVRGGVRLFAMPAGAS